MNIHIGPKKNKTPRIISAHNQPTKQPTMMIHKQQGTNFYDKNPIHFLYRFFSMCIWIGMIWIINESMITWVFVSIDLQKPIKITGNVFFLCSTFVMDVVEAHMVYNYCDIKHIILYNKWNFKSLFLLLKLNQKEKQ